MLCVLNRSGQGVQGFIHLWPKDGEFYSFNINFLTHFHFICFYCFSYTGLSSSCIFSSFSARWTVLWGRRHSVHLRYRTFMLSLATVWKYWYFLLLLCRYSWFSSDFWVYFQSDSNWWKGTCKGRTGLIPSNYGKESKWQNLQTINPLLVHLKECLAFVKQNVYNMWSLQTLMSGKFY